MPRSDRWSDIAALQADLARKPPPWMKGAILTAVGPKQVGGRPIETPTLAVMVRKKQKRRDLERTLRIPRSIAGIATDVLAARPPEPGASELPAPPSRFGAGSALMAANEVATLGVFGNSGQVFLSAGHFVEPGRNVVLRRSGRVVGRSVSQFLVMRGDELYPSWSSVQGRDLLVDCSVIERVGDEEPEHSMPGGGELRWGLPGNWLDRAWSKRAVAPVENAHGTAWLRGRVTHQQPLPLIGGRASALGLFLVSLTGPPPDGASGTTWFIEDQGGWLGLGLHWGRRLRGNAAFAIVTHAFQAYRQMGLVALG
jgi:hypothetical protein